MDRVTLKTLNDVKNVRSAKTMAPCGTRLPPSRVQVKLNVPMWPTSTHHHDKQTKQVNCRASRKEERAIGSETALHTVHNTAPCDCQSTLQTPGGGVQKGQKKLKTKLCAVSGVCVWEREYVRLHPSVIISLSALVSLRCLHYTKDKTLTPQWRIKQKKKTSGEENFRESLEWDKIRRREVSVGVELSGGRFNDPSGKHKPPLLF